MEQRTAVDISKINEKIEKESAFIDVLTAEMNKVIVGQKHMVNALLIGLLGKGHILLEGVPGLAKTLSINTLAKSVHGSFSRIQFTPDLLPADVIGTMTYNIKQNEFSIKKGPIFANFVSGIILLFERPIRVGDTVTINDITGTVAKIRIRAITIIDPDRKEVIVPNKSFVTGQVTNWALSNTVTRLIVNIGVAYGSDLALVKRLLLQAANEQPGILKDPEPHALFLSFGASTLDHELRVYVGQVSERTNVTDALNRRINELFAENNIDIAFNQLDVFIKNNDSGEEIPFVNMNAVKLANTQAQQIK